MAQSHKAVVTSSTGNHGAAVAWACKQLGATATVFVPPAVNARKLELLESLDADVRVAGHDLDEAKDAARAYAETESLRFFEDGAEPLQYEAYEAIGEEIVDQCPSPPAAVLTPIGNGALAGGVGAAIGRLSPSDPSGGSGHRADAGDGGELRRGSGRRCSAQARRSPTASPCASRSLSPSSA